MIKTFKDLSFLKKVFLLTSFFLFIFLPVATFVALQPKDIKKSKAAEPEPTPTIRIAVTGFQGGGRAGTTTPCGVLNQRCCTSIPSCHGEPGQQIICYAGICRLSGTVTISPRPRLTPTPEIFNGDDTREIRNGQIQPTSTPTPTPTPTPVSSIWVP